MGRGINDIPGSIVSVDTAPSQAQNHNAAPISTALSQQQQSVGAGILSQMPENPSNNITNAVTSHIASNAAQAVAPDVITQQPLLTNAATSMSTDMNAIPPVIFVIGGPAVIRPHYYKQRPPIILLDCSRLQLGRGRIDDTVPSFRRRLELFREQTLPMLKAMDNSGRLQIQRSLEQQQTDAIIQDLENNVPGAVPTISHHTTPEGLLSNPIQKQVRCDRKMLQENNLILEGYRGLGGHGLALQPNLQKREAYATFRWTALRGSPRVFSTGKVQPALVEKRGTPSTPRCCNMVAMVGGILQTLIGCWNKEKYVFVGLQMYFRTVMSSRGILQPGIDKYVRCGGVTCFIPPRGFGPSSDTA
ncbi:hypothetical protein EVAR_72960_1 [Eumeta japonica]|uniref:Uncharacterized protein n=1 Tax=Eumeta variegata TaxID=151549 RepID=A0A4C1T7T7_EUMVA|nr:hypothetical protein EVAR_72960_1 [Eumeta japonica]